MELLRGLADIERTIVAIGSHDLVLDVAASALRRRPAPHPGVVERGVAGRTGRAARRAVPRLAGSHLLDPATGEYRCRTWIGSSAPTAWLGAELAVVRLVHRDQGWSPAIHWGSPASPSSPSRLRYVNRQRGAGAVLLDDWSRWASTRPPSSATPARSTPTSGCAAVAAGRADTGLGIQAAARAFGLDFVPVAREPYDLVLRAASLADAVLAPLGVAGAARLPYRG